MTTPFVSGRELSRAFYREAIAPLLGAVPHAAGLWGYGSDVLGYDTARSTDHGWGPRLQVFVEPDQESEVRERIDRGLPGTFHGLPTRFGWDAVPEQHHVTVTSSGAWLTRHLGFDPRTAVTDLDWLTTPQQLLLEITSGPVHVDPRGELRSIQTRLAGYPEQVRRWLLACQWRRIGQEEAFVGRAAEVGDELGSRLLAGRQIRTLMQLAFLLDRTYWPYPKWFGTAFARLPSARVLTPVLAQVLAAGGHRAREAALTSAYQRIALLHNASGVTAAVDPTVRPYHGRPFPVLMSDRFADACLAGITDPWLLRQPLVGSVDQFADSTDVLSDPHTARRLRQIYLP